VAGLDFDDAKDRARAFARETDAQFVEDGRDAPIAEGAGSIAVELLQRPERFDFLLVPLGDGALLAGIGHWMREHSMKTQLIGVCPAGAPAMNLSLRGGEVRTTKTADTIADGIAVRQPVPETLVNLRGIAHDILLVEDEAMIRAMQLVYRHHGLVTEPSGVAGLAAAMTFPGRFRGATVGIPLTGGNLTAEQMERWL